MTICLSKKCIKSILAFLVTIVLLVPGLTFSGSAVEYKELRLSLSTAKTTVEPGEVLEVTLGFDNFVTDPITGFQIEIPLVGEELEFVQGSETKILAIPDSSDIFDIYFDSVRKTLVAVYVSMNKNSALPSNTEKILSFKVKANEEITLRTQAFIKPEVFMFADINGTYNGNCGDGLSIDINSNIVATLGDVNANGKIDIADALSIFKHISGKQLLENNAFVMADIDKNGKITITDALAIFKHIAGKVLIQN